MSVPTPELPRPLPARTWRERLAGLAESFDVSPRRLLVGAVALVCISIAGWRLLAPPPPPAEMRLPFAQPSAGRDGGADPSPDTEAPMAAVRSSDHCAPPRSSSTWRAPSSPPGCGACRRAAG